MGDHPRIVLGVCGGVAAYKSAELCRRLVEDGASVAPVMTEDAHRFLGEVTLSALATEPVRTSLWDEREPIPHTRLGQWADLVLVVPATARLIGAYAAGLSHDLLTATLLATRAPVVVCPSMHEEMWQHPAVQDNVALLRRRGVGVVEPGTGRLAGGDVGTGRLAEMPEILSAVSAALGTGQGAANRDLSGQRLVVTAGGTREPLDPVRFLGNRSSGKQGHALADEAAARGGQVTLVTTADRAAAAGVRVMNVETAEEMDRAVLSLAGEADVVVMAAAVADFRPKAPAERKLKRSEGVPELLLEPTTDILAALGEGKRDDQLLVGFAAETPATSAEMRHEALAKLRRKRLDLVVANDVLAPGTGFGHDTNVVLLLDANGGERAVPLSDKREVARVVIDAVVEMRSRRSRHADAASGSDTAADEVERKGRHQ
ncbi:MAG TPA: bifunctional phosphopantothenoylcysteine decarboxylase/phosphopantothenate--cysteine ligase CoaBC [Acidimicrobiales bacterium]|nr:bifunctional phosphopantothenoylcysteine decarboxylase/phosphopantothenate--cysteine ligase CoaBC [Acidimicrobiales bacterium]